jgi:hypothetical protein
MSQEQNQAAKREKDLVIRNHYVKAVTGRKRIVSHRSGQAREYFSIRMRNEENAPFFTIIVGETKLLGGLNPEQIVKNKQLDVYYRTSRSTREGSDKVFYTATRIFPSRARTA